MQDSASTHKPKARFIPVAEFCVRPHGAQCRRCQIACPAQAISFSSEDSVPAIDDAACTKCGICMGICDGFASTRISLPNLHAHIRKIALRGELVYLTCKENVFPGFTPAGNVVVLPCLACISPELWALMLTENLPLIISCDFKYCSDCDRAPQRGEMLFTRAIEMAEEWTGGSVRFDREMPEAIEASLESEVGRREAFDSVKGDVVDVINGKRRLRNSDTLQNYYEKKERDRAIKKLNLAPTGEFSNAFAESAKSATLFTPRRKLLLEAISRNPQIAERIPVVLSDTDLELCNNCLSCTNVCLTGARNISREDGSLVFDEKLCIGCGACVAACPNGACDIAETTAEIFGITAE